MIDIITVVHQPEMPFLELQAKSIELYFEDNFVNSIQVIVNDNNSVCDLIDKSWWGKYQDRVNIVPYSLYNYECRVNGWENQQLCKLLAASQLTDKSDKGIASSLIMSPYMERVYSQALRLFSTEKLELSV